MLRVLMRASPTAPSFLFCADLVNAILAEPLRCLLGIVSEDHVRASTAEAEQRLERHFLFVEPSALSRSLKKTKKKRIRTHT